MDLPGYESESKSALEAQLRATLDVIPVYACSPDPSGAITFVNRRHSDYLGLPKDHPLRFGIAMGAAWDSHIALSHPDKKPPKNAGKRYQAATGVEDDGAGERG